MKVFKIIGAIMKIFLVTVIILIIMFLSKCGYSDIKGEYLVNSRSKVIKYFIENIDKYKDELKSIGYEAKVYDRYNNVGFKENGILKLNNRTKVFSFDRGLDSIVCYLGNDVNVYIFKSGFGEESFPLYYDDGSYSVEVLLLAPEYKEEQWNYYTTDFEEYRLFNGDDELGADLNIKKYISAQELRNLLKEGKELEDKLAKLYKKREK